MMTILLLLYVQIPAKQWQNLKEYLVRVESARAWPNFVPKRVKRTYHGQVKVKTKKNSTTARLGDTNENDRIIRRKLWRCWLYF